MPGLPAPSSVPLLVQPGPTGSAFHAVQQQPRPLHQGIAASCYHNGTMGPWDCWREHPHVCAAASSARQFCTGSPFLVDPVYVSNKA